jgi:hypothetical protein
MVNTKAMDHDDDVEHLFSWLQTPELRYREFAGAREITDTVVTWLPRSETVETAAPVSAAPPQEQVVVVERSVLAVPAAAPVAPVVVQEPVIVPEPLTRGPAMIAPVPMSPDEPVPSPSPSGPFALGAAGRGGPLRTQAQGPVLPLPTQSAPVLSQAAAPSAPQAPPAAAPAAVSGLLGGAYRENGANSDNEVPAAPEKPSDNAPRSERSLDAVFGRLGGGNRLPDPRDRLRHIPGLGPPAGRPR